MRQDQMRESDNVEDRRGESGGGGSGFGGFGGGGGGGLGGLGGLLGGMLAGRGGGGLLKGGFGTVVVIAIVLFIAFSNSRNQPGGAGGLGGSGGMPSSATGASGSAPGATNDAGKQFVSRVLGDTEDVWTEQFRKMGKNYRAPKLVLFTGYTETACGGGDAATGPFYCPADQKVYIDLSFYDELSRRFGAPGDFAQAYVIAHEVGHHVQKLLGTSDRVQAMMERASERERNDLSVRLELQADFYAGVWAHHAQAMRNVLEAGDVEEGLRAAAAIGDDHLQRQANGGRGRVQPEKFTHGTSAQRVKWFKRGLETGDVSLGDTFSIPSP
ncbi:MAG: neutral zinc metallopeptidase [Phycisphaerales bacterium]